MTRYTKKLMLMVLVLLLVPLGGVGYMTVKARARSTEEVYTNVSLANTLARVEVTRCLEFQRLALQPLLWQLEQAGGSQADETLQAWLSTKRPRTRLHLREIPWRQLRLVVYDDLWPDRLRMVASQPPAQATTGGVAVTPWGRAFARSPQDPPLAVAGPSRERTLFLLSPLTLDRRPAALVAVGSLDDLGTALASLALPPAMQFHLLDSRGEVLLSLPGTTPAVPRIDLLAYEQESLSPEAGEYTNVSGAAVVGAHARIPHTSWEVLGEVEADRALAGVHTITVKNRWLNAFVILGVALVVLMGARGVTGPVAALSEAVRRVSEGDLGARVTIKTGDELENLGEGFNQMVVRLQGLYLEMDAQVKERTRELDAANVDLQDANRRLEEASRIKSQFLATMSHELRTPLNAIIGFSELMADEIPGPLTEDQKQCVDDVLDSGRHLLGLINNILDLSKIEAGRMEVIRRPFDLRGMLEALARNLQPLADRKQHALALEVPADLPPLEADEGKVRQVITNLVGNAVKFTPDGGRITLSAAREEGAFRLAVTDTGVGISEEDQKLIFEEFRQVDGTYTREQEGTGLGLALTRKLVELHGGGLGVRSRPGEGSTFWFTLPDPTPAPGSTTVATPGEAGAPAPQGVQA